MNNYKIKKIFDCHDMPPDLKKKFFEFMREIGSWGNDCYIDWFINVTTDPYAVQIEVDAWLVANGADPGSEHLEGEAVLIKHWWQ